MIPNDPIFEITNHCVERYMLRSKSKPATESDARIMIGSELRESEPASGKERKALANMYGAMPHQSNRRRKWWLVNRRTGIVYVMHGSARNERVMVAVTCILLEWATVKRNKNLTRKERSLEW